MKTLHTMEYYIDLWETMNNKYKKGDPFKMLDRRMEIYNNFDLTDETLQMIINTEAQTIYENLYINLKVVYQDINDMLTGVSSLGYTTRSQEIKARQELREGFEFNCLRLKKFKEKYISEC